MKPYSEPHTWMMKHWNLILGEKAKRLAVTTFATNHTGGASQYIRYENEAKCQGIRGKIDKTLTICRWYSFLPRKSKRI